MVNFNNKLKKYQKLYSDSKFSRIIEFYTNLGYCHLTLSFSNGNFEFVVSPLSYLIIQFFDEENKNNFKLFNIDYISNKLHSESLCVKQSLDFWLSKGVLRKIKKEGTNPSKSYKTFLISKAMALARSGGTALPT